MRDLDKLIVIIPAYNEEGSIARTIKTLKQELPMVNYIIVNDGSKDNTLKICKENGYNIVNLPVNLGLAGAVKAGYLYAQRNNYEYVLQYDGDGQHRPEFIKPMLEKLTDGADIVIGSRFVSKRKSLSPRMLGSRLISMAIAISSWKRIKDPTSGMRMFNKEVLDDFASNMNSAPEPDTIAHKISEGYKVVEVQVEMDDRIAGASYLTIVRSMKYMIVQVIAILFIKPFRKKNKKRGAR